MSDPYDELFEMAQGSEPDNSIIDDAAKAPYMGPTPSADVLDLAREMNLPYDVVERNQPKVQEQAAQNKFLEMRKTAPSLARTMEDPERRAYLASSAEQLAQIEAEGRGFMDNLGRGIAERTTMAAGNLVEFIGELARMSENFATKDLGLPNPGVVFGPDGADFVWNIDEKRDISLRDVGSDVSETKFGYQPRFTWNKFKDDLTVENLAGYVVEQGGQSIPDMVMAIATLPGYIASTTQRIAEERAELADTTAPEQYMAAIVPAVLVSALEKVGAKGVFKLGEKGKSVGRKALGAAGKEAGTEFIQEQIEYAGEVLGIKEFDWLESLDRGLAGAVAGGGMGGTIRTTTAAIEEFTGQAQRSRQQESFLTSIINMAQSEAAQRSPETFQAYVEDYAADMGVENVYVDGDVVANLAQSESNSNLQALVEAANADVAIPMHQFVTLEEQTREALMPHVRLEPNGLTPAEVEEGLDVNQLVARAKIQREDFDRASEIYAEVADQIAATGAYSGQQAKQMATIIPAYVTTKAQREGMSVDEVYERMGLRIESLPDNSAQLPTQDGVTLRAQPGENDARPTTETGQNELRNQGGFRGSDGLLEPAGGQDQSDGRYAELEGLETTVEVDGRQERFGANKAARDAAQAYAERAGLDYNPPKTYAKVKRKRAEAIAQAFEDAEHRPDDPDVKAAYDAMIQETIEQYRVLMESGLVVEFIDYDKDGDPYETSPRKVIMDVRDNNHMWVFSTRDGFGSDAEFDPSQSPMLGETEFQISGQTALVNDLFRVVHDYFGHIKDGVGFRARGEENAWRSHSAMYSPLARRAMTTETRGQNSWVNYGPNGTANRNASSAETVYADQKITLLPDWVSEEGAQDAVILGQSGRLATLKQKSDEATKAVREIEKAVGEHAYDFSGTPESDRLLAELRKANEANDNAQRDAVMEAIEAARIADAPELYEAYEVATEKAKAAQKAYSDHQMWAPKKSAIGLYSEVESALFSMKIPGWKEGKSIPGDQVWNKVKKEQGIKAEELEWLGLEEFLKAGKVTRIETLGFVQSNGVVVDETVAEDGAVNAEDIEWEEEVVPFEEAQDHAYIEERIDEDFDNWFWKDDDHKEEWVRENIEEVRSFYVELIDESEYAELTDEDFIYNQIEGHDVYDDLQETAKEDEDVRANLREQLESQYYEDPTTAHTWESPDGTEFKIIGSESRVYSGFINGHYAEDFIGPDVYSFSEAEIQARYYLEESSHASGRSDETTARWEQYVTPGDYDSYREVKLTLPEIGEDYYNEVHFPDRNLVAFMRVTDRDVIVEEREVQREFDIHESEEGWILSTHFGGKGITRSVPFKTEAEAQAQLERGKVKAKEQGVESRKERVKAKAYFIDEMQSDWHQDGRKEGYQGDFTDEQILEAGKARDEAQLAFDHARTQAHERAEMTTEAPEGWIITGTDDGSRWEARRTEPPLDRMTGRSREAVVHHAVFSDDKDLLNARFELKEAQDELNKRNNGAPNAPFKNEEWMKLSLKRAVVQAVEQGKEYIAWADADVLVDRWGESFQELYEIQYDKKMPSAAKKIMKSKPIHVRGDDSNLGEMDSGETAGYWMAKITPELKARVLDEGLPLFQENRAQIMLFPNERVIQLGEQSDLSSFFHESGHLFLEMERKFAETGSAQQKADFQKILDWLGAEDPHSITVEMHEQFARGFEAYIGEGKAPSLELRPMFRRFAEWIKGVYRTLLSLNVELTDDIRGVMDRMLATDEQIARAQQRFGFDLATEVTVGTQDAKDKAEETLRTKVIRQLRRRAEKWWKDEAEQLRPVLQAEIEQEKVYKAIAALKETPIDRAQAKELLDGRKLDGNLKGITAENSVSAEYMAEFLGFASAQGMLEQIVEAPSLKQAVDEAVEQRMVMEHGDILNDGTIEREAEAAVHNEDQAKLLLNELKALNPNAPDREALKQHAAETIGRMKVSEIKPAAFHRGEVKAAKRYVKALADGDQRLAAFYKQEQLRQFYLFREANAAERRSETQRKYIKGMQTREYKDTQVDPSYIQNIKVLANLYDGRKNDRFRDLSQFTDWLMAQINAEGEFLKPQIIDLVAIKIIDAKEQARETGMDWRELVDIPSYSDMTIDQLQGVYDQLRHLRWMGGKLSNKAREERKAKNEALADSILDKGGDDIEIPDYQGALDRAKSGIKRFGADHKKIRNVVLGMDGFEDFGPAYDAIYGPIVEATNAEVEMNMDYAKRVEEIWKPMNSRLAKGVDKREVVKEDGTTWTLPARERVMLGMYWGSPESREAVLRGHGVTQIDVAKMMQHLTQTDLDFIENIWELNDSLWPAFSAMNVRAFGVSPPKVEHVPFTIHGRKMKGGYMRLYYDYSGQDAKRKDIHDSNNDFLGSGGALSMSKAGAAYSRVGSGGRRVALDPQNIFTALQDNIHAITFTETSREVSRSVQSKPVAEAFIQKYGKERYQSLLDTLEGVFIGGRSGSHPLADLMRGVRGNMSLALLGFSIRNFVQQPIAITNVFAQLGEMQTLKGLIDFYSSPLETKRMVDEKSVFMRNRTAFVNREVAEHLGSLDAGKGSKPVVFLKRHAFDLQTLGDAAVAYPAWTGAYDMGLKKFGSEAKAIAWADEQVASSIGSGLGKDLSAMLQGGGGVAKTLGTETLKQLTFMGSFFNVVFNLMNESYNRNDLKTVGGFAEFSRQMAWILVIPAVLSQLVISSFPDEDDDGYAAWFAKAIAEYGIASLFMLRDIASVAKGFEPSIPGQSLPGGLARAAKEIYEASEDEDMALNDVSGLIRGLQPAFPLPGSGQVARFLDYMHSYEQGKEGDFRFYDALVEGKERNK